MAEKLYRANRRMFAGHGMAGRIVEEGEVIPLDDLVFTKPKVTDGGPAGPAATEISPEEAARLAPVKQVKVFDPSTLAGVQKGERPALTGVNAPPAGQEGNSLTNADVTEGGQGQGDDTGAGEGADDENKDALSDLSKDEIKDKLENAGIALTSEIARMNKADLVKEARRLLDEKAAPPT